MRSSRRATFVGQLDTAGRRCLSCHTVSSIGPPPKGARYAGLVISVPVKDD